MHESSDTYKRQHVSLPSGIGPHQEHYRHQALRPLRQFDQNTSGLKDPMSSCWKR